MAASSDWRAFCSRVAGICSVEHIPPDDVKAGVYPVFRSGRGKAAILLATGGLGRINRAMFTKPRSRTTVAFAILCALVAFADTGCGQGSDNDTVQLKAQLEQLKKENQIASKSDAGSRWRTTATECIGQRCHLGIKHEFRSGACLLAYFVEQQTPQ